MRLHLILVLGLAGTGCVESSVDAEHPETGFMHYPSGICAAQDWVHIVSSNHDQRFSSGALLSFLAADLAADRFEAKAVRHGANGLPWGFGRVLDLAFCAGGKVGLVDRAQKLLLVIPLEEDGSVADDLAGIRPIALGQRDPGHGVLQGDWILLGSRVDESAALLGPGPEQAAGESLSRRPVRGGNALLPVLGLEAVSLDSEGEAQTLSQVGWNGSLDSLAGTAGGGHALHRTGKASIEFSRREDQLVMVGSTDLSAQHRRMMRGHGEGDFGELWFFGGEPVVEIHWGDPQRMTELWFDPRFVRLEDGIPLGELAEEPLEDPPEIRPEPGSALFTSFVPAGVDEGAPLLRLRAADRSVEVLR